MNMIIGAVIGFAVATATVVGGVSAYTNTAQPVDSTQLYTYADQ